MQWGGWEAVCTETSEAQFQRGSGDFPWQPSGPWALPLRGMQVWSLARELRSHMPYSSAKRKEDLEKREDLGRTGGKFKAGWEQNQKMLSVQRVGKHWSFHWGGLQSSQANSSTEKSHYRILDRREIYVTLWDKCMLVVLEEGKRKKNQEFKKTWKLMTSLEDHCRRRGGGAVCGVGHEHVHYNIRNFNRKDWCHKFVAFGFLLVLGKIIGGKHYVMVTLYFISKEHELVAIQNGFLITNLNDQRQPYSKARH